MRNERRIYVAQEGPNRRRYYITYVHSTQSHELISTNKFANPHGDGDAAGRALAFFSLRITNGGELYATRNRDNLAVDAIEQNCGSSGRPFRLNVVSASERDEGKHDLRTASDSEC